MSRKTVAILGINDVPVGLRVTIDVEELYRKAAEMDVPPFDFKLVNDLSHTRVTKSGVVAAYNIKEHSVKLCLPLAVSEGLGFAEKIASKNGRTPALDTAWMRSSIVSSLAHEVRHAWQFTGKNKRWARIQESILRVIFGSLFIGIAINTTITMCLIWLDSSMPDILKLGLLASYIYFGRIWVESGSELAHNLAYKYSWAERDARRFEKEAMRDPSWLNIVEVNIEVINRTNPV